LCAVIASLNVSAQNPAFPSIDAAFAKVILSNHEGSIFEATGLHANKFKLLPKKEAREWNDRYSEENSYFSAYSSPRCQELYWASKPNYPNDECHVIFSAVSPKVGSEEYYSVSFEVIYSRLKNSVLTNTWEFKWVVFGGAYTYNKKGLDGKLMLDNVVKALMQTTKPAGQISYGEPVNLNGNVYTCHFDFNDFASIDSIVYKKKENSNDRFYLTFYGAVQAYESGYKTSCFPSYSQTKKLEAKVDLTLSNGKVIETHLREDFGSETFNRVEKPKEGFKTSEELTFAQLYKKPKQVKCVSPSGEAVKFESPAEKKSAFFDCLKTVLADGNKLISPESLKKYFAPNDNTSYDSFVNYFKALEDQGYGWKDFKDGGQNAFKYTIFGKKLLNRSYKETKDLIYFEKEVSNVVYFQFNL